MNFQPQDAVSALAVLDLLARDGLAYQEKVVSADAFEKMQQDYETAMGILKETALRATSGSRLPQGAAVLRPVPDKNT